MGRWMLLAMGLFAGMGVLAFLRLVSNEVALRIRALHLRVKAEEEERERERSTQQQEAVVDAEAA